MIIKETLSTEKATKLIEATNTIVVIVDKKATKDQIKSELEKSFEVKIEKINTVITPTGIKKAYIRLKPEYKAVDLAQKLGIL
ncbi:MULTISPECIES: 50S ribosomal protein L23 [Acidianus]|uniref:50S ribosomal protein L23 n=1 Tax=Acidianus TaxID=12914 RepID=UPI00064FE04A|nr:MULTISPECIES: 50S ribosomal protein L23 [Acidianus]NON62508.1 50S ribosomal protein L23 [Acidianus sp. RZ1]